LIVPTRTTTTPKKALQKARVMIEFKKNPALFKMVKNFYIIKNILKSKMIHLN